MCEVGHLIEFHCLPHCLELSMLEMGCQYVKEVYNILHLVWKTYHCSPKSKHELRALGNELGLDVLKARPVKGSRWLPHVSGALRVFIKPHKNEASALILPNMQLFWHKRSTLQQYQPTQTSKEGQNSFQNL